MNALTPFGKVVRKKRIDRSETLGDMARALGVSVAYLSAVETGRKNVTNEIAAKTIKHFELDDTEQEMLLRSVEQSKKDVKINLHAVNSVEARELAMAFARQFADLDADQISKIRTALKPKGY